MPVNQKLMASLVEEYGPEKGKRIYYAMEQEGHPATKVKKRGKGKSAIQRAATGEV